MRLADLLGPEPAQRLIEFDTVRRNHHRTPMPARHKDELPDKAPEPHAGTFNPRGAVATDTPSPPAGAGLQGAGAEGVGVGQGSGLGV